MWWLTYSAFLQNSNFVLSIIVPNIAASLTIILGVVAGKPLLSSDAFTILASFNIIRLPVSMLPAVVKSSSEAIVAFERLQTFLLLPELEDTRIFDPESKFALSLENASFILPKNPGLVADGEKSPKKVSSDEEQVPLDADGMFNSPSTLPPQNLSLFTISYLPHLGSQEDGWVSS